VSQALLLVDLQNDYFPGGAFPLPAIAPCAANAAKVLAWARARGVRVVHIQHCELDPAVGFLLDGSPGAETHAAVAPTAGETVVVKRHPNAFRETALVGTLAGIDSVVVVGAMSNMCVDATARAAADLGYGVTVVEDACAACDLEFGGKAIPAETVHGAFMAALAPAYGRVVTAEALLAEG
jgi:nicotinamidase-related amidase